MPASDRLSAIAGASVSVFCSPRVSRYKEHARSRPMAPMVMTVMMMTMMMMVVMMVVMVMMMMMMAMMMVVTMVW